MMFAIFLSPLISQENIYGQGLSVELSIEWTRGSIPFEVRKEGGYDSVLIPVLEVTYRNLSGRSVYLRKLIDDSEDFPTLTSSSINSTMDYADRALKYINRAGNDYIVHIGRPWEILNDSTDALMEHEMDEINNDLFEIYSVLKIQHLLKENGIKKRLSCFRPDGNQVIGYREARRLLGENVVMSNAFEAEVAHLSEELILTKWSSEFLFLKDREVFTQKFDLIGFFLVAGNFNFQMSNTKVLDHVVRQNQMIYLPKHVDGYELYEGTFYTSSVSIRIDE